VPNELIMAGKMPSKLLPSNKPLESDIDAEIFEIDA
jgi:hypothetical protein